MTLNTELEMKTSIPATTSPSRLELDLPYNPRLPSSVVTYTVADVAHALRVSNSTVYRYKDRGLKLIQIGGEGGHTGVRHDDLILYLEACPRLRARSRLRAGNRLH